jgi:uncharacterized membrane protein YbhN (UPF0104 family)
MTDAAQVSTAKSRIWPIVKWLLFAILLFFVSRRAWQLWSSAPRESVEIQWSWLILAGIAYAIGWLPSVWFWRELLRKQGQTIGLWQATRAYFIGHLGKYIPGKALVLVIRAAWVKDQGVNPYLAGASAAYETLVFMATGAAIAIALAPFTLTGIPLSEYLNGFKTLGIAWPLIVVAITFATTPFSAWLFSKLSHKTMAGTAQGPGDLPSISPALISQGVVVTALGWGCHALSLGCVLQSISQQPVSLNPFFVWLTSTCLSTVSGFIVLIAPGGVGVREGMLVETLRDQPHVGSQLALIAAALLRIVWFVTELLVAAIFFALSRIQRGK